MELDSPFYPGVPVSSDDFAGRKEELKEFTRPVSRVINGRRIEGVLITGERGVGKSSFSKYVSRYFGNLTNMKKPLANLVVDLRPCHDFDSFISAVHFALFEKMREQQNVWDKLGKKLYGGLKKIDGVSVFGVGVNFTREEKERLFSDVILFEKSLELYTETMVQKGEGGLMVILDNINSVVNDIRFSNYLKGITDNLKEPSQPILFVINAIPETWDIIHKNQPSVSRSYARIELQELDYETVKGYFEKTFENSGVSLTESNLEVLAYASGGLPLPMQFVGDRVYWECEGGKQVVNDKVIEQGILNAMREIGDRYLDKQIFSVMQSELYKSIISNDEFLHHSGEVLERIDIRRIIDKTKFRIKKENNKLCHLDSDEAKNLTESFLVKMCETGILIKLGDDPVWRFKNKFTQAYLAITKLITVSGKTKKKVDRQSKSVKKFFSNLENNLADPEKNNN